MKITIPLNYLIFLLLFYANCFSQHILPFAQGNTWVYSDGDSERIQLTVDGKIFRDSIEYFTVSNSHKIFRLRDDGYYVYTSLSDSIEHIYYKKTAKLDDYWTSIGEDGFETRAMVIDSTLITKFGQEVILKGVWLDLGLNVHGQGWTEEFGLLYEELSEIESTAQDHTIYQLEGCIINGIAFGDTSLVSGIEKMDISLDTDFILHQNYPNPFNPTTEIKFALPVTSSVKLTIYNMMGQEIKTYESAGLSQGTHQFTWNGTNRNNETVTSGIYIYMLRAVGQDGQIFKKNAKMILLR